MNRIIISWYYFQNILSIILLIISHQNLYSFDNSIKYIFSICLFLSVIVEVLNISNKFIITINKFIQIIAQPLAIVYAWTLLFVYTNNYIFKVCLLFYYVLMFIPFSFIITKNIFHSYNQLIILIWEFNSIVLINSSGPNNIFIKTFIFAAFSFLIFIILNLHNWNYNYPNLPQNQNMNYFVFIVLILFISLFIFLNAWNNVPSYKVLLHQFITKPSLTLSAVEAGVAEEILCRYAILAILLRWLNRFKYKLFFSIICSAIIFGSLHLVNARYQTLSTTISQIIFAICAGILFAIIYLYSGKILLPMFFHFITDWSSNIISSAQNINVLGPKVYYISSILPLLIILLIILCILNWMMFGKRKLVMEEHANELIKLK